MESDRIIGTGPSVPWKTVTEASVTQSGSSSASKSPMYTKVATGSEKSSQPGSANGDSSVHPLKATLEAKSRQTTARIVDIDCTCTAHAARVHSAQRRFEQAAAGLRMLREISGEKPAMWGPSIIGYGTYQDTKTMG